MDKANRFDGSTDRMAAAIDRAKQEQPFWWDNGRKVGLLDTSPEVFGYLDTQTAVPPDVERRILERIYRRAMKTLDKKPAGRKRLSEKGEPSRPEQMLADLKRNGYDFNATAERFGVKAKTVEDKTRKLRR